MRKHRPFVKRDIIWKWNSHKFSLPYLKFNFPPWRGPQRSFSRCIRTRGWKYSTMIIRSAATIRDVFSLSFFFFFLPSFLSFYFLNRGKQEYDWFNGNHGRCVHGMPWFRSVSKKRRCTSIHSVFQHLNSTIVIRILDYLSPLLQRRRVVSSRFDFPPPITLIARVPRTARSIETRRFDDR